MKNSPEEFEAIMQQRLPFLQETEESLKGRVPVICADLSNVGSEITTPTSLQHVGEQMVEITKGDWTTAKGLRSPIIPYLTELVELWETIFERHRAAGAIFAGASNRPYCLVLRSFKTVTNPIEVPGARVVMFVNEPGLDANLAATLAAEAEWLNPVSCLHTDDMQLLDKSGALMPAFRVQSSNWQEILSDVIAGSGLIIFYLDGDSPGVKFEIDRISEYGLEPQTIIVYRGDRVPASVQSDRYAGIILLEEFLDVVKDKTGPGKLSKQSKRLLKKLISSATGQSAVSSRLLRMPCQIVDPGCPDDIDQIDPETSYFVTESNAAAFVSYVLNLPDSFLRWNAISQDMRLRGIQPSVDEFNALYLSLRMAFISAACLGFTSSISCTIGLLSKVTSMVKHEPAENQERVELYMQILDIARRFDALTEQHGWSDKIEAFRDSILEDPFM